MFHNRYRKWPIFLTHKHKCPVPRRWIYSDTLLLASLSREVGGMLAVLSELTAEDDILTISTKNLRESNHIEFLGCID
jgi:hypothetical protein